VLLHSITIKNFSNNSFKKAKTCMQRTIYMTFRLWRMIILAMNSIGRGRT
jgi:hypothetical protein